MTVELSQVELDFHAARYRGPNRAATIDHAHRQALAWVDEHAPDMLPTIRAGIVRNYFCALLENDAGERKLLMGAIDALLELGRAINASSEA